MRSRPSKLFARSAPGLLTPGPTTRLDAGILTPLRTAHRPLRTAHCAPLYLSASAPAPVAAPGRWQRRPRTSEHLSRTGRTGLARCTHACILRRAAIAHATTTLAGPHTLDPCDTFAQYPKSATPAPLHPRRHAHPAPNWMGRPRRPHCSRPGCPRPRPALRSPAAMTHFRPPPATRPIRCQVLPAPRLSRAAAQAPQLLASGRLLAAALSQLTPQRSLPGGSHAPCLASSRCPFVFLPLHLCPCQSVCDPAAPASTGNVTRTCGPVLTAMRVVPQRCNTCCQMLCDRYLALNNSANRVCSRDHIRSDCWPAVAENPTYQRFVRS